jgi:hypothetical protein
MLSAASASAAMPRFSSRRYLAAAFISRQTPDADAAQAYADISAPPPPPAAAAELRQMLYFHADADIFAAILLIDADFIDLIFAIFFRR